VGELGEVEQAMTEVRFPQMRADAVDAVRSLADPDHQQRVWLRREYPQPGYFDDLTTNITILYDDTRVLEDPAATVGAVLRSDREAAALAPLAEALDKMFAEMGTSCDDASYLNSAHWPAVVEAARSALGALTSPE
jgi:hypothetical protein